jgi:hypothetical protein
MKPLDELGSTLRVPDSLRDPQPPVNLDRWEKIAILAPNVHIAELIQREYRDKPWIKVIWPGVVTCGHRFALILASGHTLNDVTKFGTETVKSWWREAVLTRLTRDGQIIALP